MKEQIKKLDFTFNFQQQKLIEELLTEEYFKGYEGLVDIDINISNYEGTIQTEFFLKRVKEKDLPKKNSLRFHIKQGQGYKIAYSR
jgi:hypothetical protein